MSSRHGTEKSQVFTWIFYFLFYSVLDRHVNKNRQLTGRHRGETHPG